MEEKIIGSFKKNTTGKEISYEILESYGALGDFDSNWKKELNIVSWNGNPPKYDIRGWNKKHDCIGKGITLTTSELRALKEILNNIDLD